MRLNSNSYAYDSRFEESVYSGDNQESAEAVSQLLVDYPRALESERFQSGSRQELGERQAEDESFDASQYRAVSKARLDELVAPLSKRIPDRLAGLKQRSFTPVAEWEGFVESIREQDFTLRLVNVNSKTALADEEATFSLTELSAEQRSNLQVGAIVRWVIGLERLPSDQRRRVSELHFRRLPAHSLRDFERAKLKAQQLIEGINWDDAA